MTKENRRVYSNGLTYSCNNLCLHPKLSCKTPGNIIDTSLTIADDIGYSSDLIEHVTTRKEENGDQANRSPDISITDNWQNVWRQYCEKGHCTHCKRNRRNKPFVVDRAYKRGLGSLWQMSADPGVELVGRNGAATKHISSRFTKVAI